MHSEIDQRRDQTEERKEMHSEIDRRRDQTKKRKEMHSNIDQKRDQTEERKARDQTEKRKKMHQKIDQIRDLTEERVFHHKFKNSLRYQKKLLESYHTDTGFDCICSSCLQYKKMEFCRPVTILSEEKLKQFIVRYCGLLKNRSNIQHVCNLCLKDIKLKKTPKRSKKNKFGFANFPTYLIKKLKTVCKTKQSDLPSNTIFDEENNQRQSVQLNRLESYLLKLVIPFIRVIHCPRGSYFKVKGDLILISADVCHSLSKILPVDQSLIPVCFKRKLSYTGSYIEEYIEKPKVKMYFSWFKQFNHLYKDIDLDSTLVDTFKLESLAATKDFERLSKRDEDVASQSEDESGHESENNEEDDDILNFSKKDTFKPCTQDDKDITHDQTTMFLNKYCEDPNLPSVANRVAETIIEYEVNREIPFTPRDDVEIDDEIITEEEFLRNVDEEMNFQDQTETVENTNLEEILPDISTTHHKEVNDEINNQMDMMVNPSEEQTALLASIAKRQAKSAVEKMEKICVAPGESGTFKNWNAELFLEEKCFPEKFPYGTGGYLSSMINGGDNNMGFANYCINQIMSCDPKFRQDSSYIFFLLLVKELIQLKRCRTTYLRQATRLPNLSREDILNVDHENLSRFNRSYQVFKSCPWHINVLRGVKKKSYGSSASKWMSICIFDPQLCRIRLARVDERNCRNSGKKKTYQVK